MNIADKEARAHIWVAAAAYAPRRFVKPIGIAAIVLTLAALAVTQGWTL